MTERTEDLPAEFERWWFAGPAGKGYSRIKCAKLAWEAARKLPEPPSAAPVSQQGWKGPTLNGEG